MFHILEGYLKLEFCHVFDGGETTVPRHYCLYVSLLHAKFIIITNTNAKRKLIWGNGSDAKRGLVDVGLHVK